MPGHSFPGTGWIIRNLKIFLRKIFPWWISTCDTFVMLSDPPRHFPPLLTHSQPSDPPWEGSPVICITLKTNCETMSRRQSTMQRAGLSLPAVVASSSENKTASSVSECPGQFYIRPFISHLQSRDIKQFQNFLDTRQSIVRELSMPLIPISEDIWFQHYLLSGYRPIHPRRCWDNLCSRICMTGNPADNSLW